MTPLAAFAVGCCVGPVFLAGAGLLIMLVKDGLDLHRARLRDERLSRYFGRDE